MNERTTMAKRKGIVPIESGRDGIWRQKPKYWSLPQNAPDSVLNRSPSIRKTKLRSTERRSANIKLPDIQSDRSKKRRRLETERGERRRLRESAPSSYPASPFFQNTGGPPRERKKRKQTNARYARDVPPTRPFYAQSRLNTRPYP